MTTGSCQALERLVGMSSAIRGLHAFIPKVAARNCNVLITGETGTGKERVAEAIHSNSSRSNRDFVCVNCAAVPDALLESELFGYEKGAFTGAYSRFRGRLQEAEGGTVFLDEIGDMSPVSQAKILRAIEQKQIYKIGGRAPEPLDIRVIAATNRDLRQMVANQQFRSDLYYRLNVVNVHLPPLRERPEDVALLFDYYMREMSTGEVNAQALTTEAMTLLMHYDWPGNIREIRNLVELLLIEPARKLVSPEDLPSYMRCGNSMSQQCERERRRVHRARRPNDEHERVRRDQC